VLIGVLAAVIAAGGGAEIARGYLMPGLTDLLAAVLGAVIGVFAWLNLRVLDQNRALLDSNRDLQALNARLLEERRNDLGYRMQKRLAIAEDRARYDEGCD
jgi:hypothetical protein